MTGKRLSCDIFCAVIDNYGDVGVSWRLARQLAAEHGYRVRLWVDGIAALLRLCPRLSPDLPSQTLEGVEVRRWDRSFEQVAAADLVIEAFGCELPEPYLEAMAARAAAGSSPRWINLEYLSAEAWVAGSHGLPSPHPRLPLTKHFFIPGYGAPSGGLLRESGLLQWRGAWNNDWAELGLPPPAADEITVSLFCYENPALNELLQAWGEGGQRLRCLLAAGPAQAQAAAWLGLSVLPTGQTERRGQLSVTALPFYEQDAYDRLLWSCDFNFVRGEDSFVRAQWAQRPLLWQAYPQGDAAHLAKLDAFLERYCAGMPPPAATAYRAFSRIWNGDAAAGGAAAAWTAMLAWRAVLAEHARRWAERLAAEQDLATRLVNFVEALV